MHISYSPTSFFFPEILSLSLSIQRKQISDTWYKTQAFHTIAAFCFDWRFRSRLKREMDPPLPLSLPLAGFGMPPPVKTTITYLILYHLCDTKFTHMKVTIYIRPSSDSEGKKTQ
ncbi:hypothetical protein AA313_de0202168 [Arthrobotrys entomopaga]|nr:hypothetical protein AA313_de0202168 [Arthrobotrys entomopaga]